MGTHIHRGNIADLPATLEPAERREQAGEARMTLWHRMERIAAEHAPHVRQAMDAALNLGRRVSHQVQQRWQQPDRGYERER